MKWPEHGGQPQKILALTGYEQSNNYYDFSANLNPLGPPHNLKKRWSEICRQIELYPDPDYHETTRILSIHEGVKEDHILLTNGGSEAIFLAAQQFVGKRALIIEPTFSEYERACHVYGLSVKHVHLNRDHSFSFPVDEVLSELSDTDVVFLCRPNNPTGTMVELTYIEMILKKGLLTNTTLIVDEAFIHFVNEDHADLSFLLDHYPNLLLLRSLTKVYAIPGLRLGYILAKPERITRIKHTQIPWSLNGVVTSLVPDLISDHYFVEQTKTWLKTQLKYLTAGLTELGYYVSPTCVNFYLLKDGEHQDTDKLFNYLLENKIIPRHTHTFSGIKGDYLRLAVRSEKENKYLLEVLQNWKNKNSMVTG